MIQNLINRFVAGASINSAMLMFTKAVDQLQTVEQREIKRAEDAAELAQTHLAAATAAREHAGLARKQREKITALFNNDVDSDSSKKSGTGQAYSGNGVYVVGDSIQGNAWHTDGLNGLGGA